jgi:GNAT superfamily N-acetyltransferase
MNISLQPLHPSDREQFIKDNQEAFNYGALEEFGLRNDRFEETNEDGNQIISRETIAASIENGTAYRILLDNVIVGGAVIKIDGTHGELELLFISPEHHSKGIGYAAWCEIEKMHPEVNVWETFTPYFEKRNIHFYVNRCGFHIVEFFNKQHLDEDNPAEDGFEMFRFEKRME